ncbi:MAG: MBL fold metallo-hydrolase [Armatimonadetes bacterium]|nr:MBL fold metallo-hydrolase [Armatimonadota bacterium]MDW8028094.1 MBL fold metallo-hydrolase [Armatimonadota bacterium]
MLLKFCGAAGEVTGSCHMVQVEDTIVLLDCGIFQGGEERHIRNRQPFPFDPQKVKAVLLSHAHLDHCGRLPLLVKAGFKGKIFATDATCDLTKIVLLDAAKLQEEDAAWKIKRLKKKGEDWSWVSPLFTVQEAEQVFELFEPIPYGEWLEISPNLRFRFHDAGHLLGSAMVELRWQSDGIERKLLFTGDLGQKGLPIVRDPEPIEEADLLLMESTYGNRDHTMGFKECVEKLQEIVKETVHRGGRVLIPSFAVGRTQEILYALNDLVESKQLPILPVFVDSPMARAVLKVYQRHRELYDEEAEQKVIGGDEPFTFPGLKIIETVDESKMLNEFSEPCIIIAGSGMCTGGRIKHHLWHGIGNYNNAIVFVGFQAKGSLGRQLVEGVSPVRIFGEMHEVRAKIFMLDGFSAHADRKSLLQWTSNFVKPPAQTFAVHGEQEASIALVQSLKERFWNATVPQLGQELKM